jgi:hypothetical protein
VKVTVAELPSFTLRDEVLKVGELIVAVVQPSVRVMVNSTLSEAPEGANATLELPPLSAIVIVFCTLTV